MLHGCSCLEAIEHLRQLLLKHLKFGDLLLDGA
jgi:hypothetical protein